MMPDGGSLRRQPTLVISGAEDQATSPADGRFLAEQITGADYLQLAAARLSNIEEVEGYADAVLAFLGHSEHVFLSEMNGHYG